MTFKTSLRRLRVNCTVMLKQMINIFNVAQIYSVEVKMKIIVIEILFGVLFLFYNIPYQSPLIVDCKESSECFTFAIIFSWKICAN